MSVVSSSSIEYQVKINNIYASWARSKKKERSVLNNIDGFNAALGGMASFETLIGLNKSN